MQFVSKPTFDQWLSRLANEYGFQECKRRLPRAVWDTQPFHDTEAEPIEGWKLTKKTKQRLNGVKLQLTSALFNISHLFKVFIAYILSLDFMRTTVTYIDTREEAKGNKATKHQ